MSEGNNGKFYSYSVKDDREKTIIEWRENGGIAVLHTTPEETIRER